MVICNDWLEPSVLAAARFDLAVMSRLELMILDVEVYHYGEFGRHYSERTIPLRRANDIVCLVTTDSYDDVMYVVHFGTLAQAYT